MPYTKLWVHFIWSTKNRAPILLAPLRAQLFGHIKEYSSSKHIRLDTIGGCIDHVHALVERMPTQTEASIMHFLKGESAHWVNAEKLCPGHFEWQEEYCALSVSSGSIDVVRRYIRNQEEHHRVKTFQEEYEAMIRLTTSTSA